MARRQAEAWSIEKSDVVYVQGTIKKNYYACKEKHIHMKPFALSYKNPDNQSEEMTLHWIHFGKETFDFEVPEMCKEKKEILYQRLEALSTLHIPVDLHMRFLKWYSTDDNLPSDRLAKFLLIAFERNMLDSEGKIALRELCREVLDMINIQDIDVLQLGGVSKKSRYGEIIDLEFEVKSSSDYSSPKGKGEGDKNESAEACIRKFTPLVVPQTTRQLSTPLTMDCSYARKIFVPDVIICKNYTLSEPPSILMIISIKKGFQEESLMQLQLEMASHMSRQDEIFGLQICCKTASLVYMVKCVRTNRLFVKEFPSYKFYAPDKNDKFQVNYLLKMVGDMVTAVYWMYSQLKK